MTPSLIGLLLPQCLLVLLLLEPALPGAVMQQLLIRLSTASTAASAIMQQMARDMI
jgi:hypothetical protein